MLFNVLKQCSPAELEQMDDAELPEEVKANLMNKPETDLATNEAKTKRKMDLRNKIKSVGRMNMMLSNMRKN